MVITKELTCENCKKEHDGSYGSGRYCSNFCGTAVSGRKKKIKYCLTCSIVLENTRNKYCSRKCKKEVKYLQFITDWKNGLENGTLINSGRIQLPVKRYIWEKYNHKCARCKWDEVNPSTGKSPLEIDHIDGDWTNSTEENLILLCPNCHALTPTYRALNRRETSRPFSTGKRK